MNWQHMLKRSWREVAVSLLMAALLLQGSVLNASSSEQVAVYLNSDAFIILEEARLSPGSSTQTLRFTLKLVNNSATALDYNSYGVAIVDEAGTRYKVELAEMVNARIMPGKEREIKYSANLPAGLSLQQLHVQIFSWNFSGSSFFDIIGQMPFTAVVSSGESAKPEIIFNLNDADSTNKDALVGIQLEDSFKILTDGVWNLYVYASVENKSSSSFKLPAALQIVLQNEEGLRYDGSIISGGDQAVLPRQTQSVVLQFPIGNIMEDAINLVLEFSVNEASSDSVVLGVLDLIDSYVVLPVQEEQDYAGQSSVLSAATMSGSAAARSDGIHLKAVWRLQNVGEKAVAVPSLAAFYQLDGSTLSVAATDALSHPVYLAAGEYTDYRFEAILPAGVDTKDVQLVVRENKGGVAIPVFVSAMPESAQSAVGSVAVADGVSYYTSAGRLALTIASSYKLLTETGNDVLMTELQVENLESKIVKLPELYAAYTDGDLELPGTAVRIQSSPYLSAGEKTTIYLYTELPYNISLDSGYIFFGEKELDSRTDEIVQSKEWARLPYEITGQEIQTVGWNQDWSVADPGRQSTVRIVDETVYDTADNKKLIAVRIAQQNQENRTVQAIPYAGYFIDEDGSVWVAQTTQTSGQVSRNGWSLATLWLELPSSYDNVTALVLGHGIDEQIFAAPRQYSVNVDSPSNVAVHVNMGSEFRAAVRPFNISFTNMRYGLNGNQYEFNFTYHLIGNFNVVEGSHANRSLFIVLTDGTGKTYQEWDIPLEGSGSLLEGSMNKLIAENLTVIEMLNLSSSAKLTVYEKFEGATRLLGTITAY